MLQVWTNNSVLHSAFKTQVAVPPEVSTVDEPEWRMESPVQEVQDTVGNGLDGLQAETSSIIFQNVEAASPTREEAIRLFSEGYLSVCTASCVHLTHIIVNVAPCEGGWQQDPGNPNYKSTMQFHPSTWASARRSPDSDWKNWWELGWATANWIDRLYATGSHPGSTGGWPTCWWKGLN